MSQIGLPSKSNLEVLFLIVTVSLTMAAKDKSPNIIIISPPAPDYSNQGPPPPPPHMMPPPPMPINIPVPIPVGPGFGPGFQGFMGKNPFLGHPMGMDMGGMGPSNALMSRFGSGPDFGGDLAMEASGQMDMMSAMPGQMGPMGGMGSMGPMGAMAGMNGMPMMPNIFILPIRVQSERGFERLSKAAARYGKPKEHFEQSRRRVLAPRRLFPPRPHRRADPVLNPVRIRDPHRSSRTDSSKPVLNPVLSPPADNDLNRDQRDNDRKAGRQNDKQVIKKNQVNHIFARSPSYSIAFDHNQLIMIALVALYMF